MATSDDFKRNLKAGNLSQALRVALSNAIELEITTWVVPIDADPMEVQTPKPGYQMRTRINMVDGDIENEIGSRFLSNGPYAELQEFHLSQVKRGRDTIRKNLQSLEALFSVWLDPTKPPTSSTAPALTTPQKSPQLPPTTAPTTVGVITPSVVTVDPVMDIGELPFDPRTENLQPAPEFSDPAIDISSLTPSGGDDFFSEPALFDPNHDAGTIAPSTLDSSPAVAEPIFTEPEPIFTEPTFSGEFAAPPVDPIFTGADSVAVQPIEAEGSSFGIDSSLSGGISGTWELEPSLEESLPSLGTAATTVKATDLPVLPDLLASPTQIAPHPETLAATIAPSLEESLAAPSVAPTPVGDPAFNPTPTAFEVTSTNEANLIEFDPALFGEPMLPPSSASADLSGSSAAKPTESLELFIEPSGNPESYASLVELFTEPKVETPAAEVTQAEPSPDTTFNASLATFDAVGVAQTSYGSASLEAPMEAPAAAAPSGAPASEPSSMADFDLNSLTPPFAEPSPEEFDIPFSTLAVSGSVEAEAESADMSMADFDLSALETPSGSASDALDMETIDLEEADWLEAEDEDEADETIMEPDFELDSLSDAFDNVSESDAAVMEPDFGLGSFSSDVDDDEFDETIFEPDLPIGMEDEDEPDDATVLEPDLLSGLLDDDEFDETIVEPDFPIERQTVDDSSLTDLFAEPETPASPGMVEGEAESSESLADLFAEPPSLADYPPLTTPESSLEAAAHPQGLDDLDFSASSSSPELEQSLAALFAEPSLEDPNTSNTAGLDDGDALSALFAESSEDESDNLFADLSVADAEAYLASHPELGLDLGADALDLDSITLDLDSPQSKRQSGDDRHPSGS